MKNEYVENIKAKFQAKVCLGLRMHDQGADADRIEKNGTDLETLLVMAYQMRLIA